MRRAIALSRRGEPEGGRPFGATAVGEGRPLRLAAGEAIEGFRQWQARPGTVPC